MAFVDLTVEEARLAMRAGAAWDSEVDAEQINHYTVNIPTKLAHQLGCAGEIAICKLLGIEWGGHSFKNRSHGDAGLIEVRCSRANRGHHLLCNARDLKQGKSNRKFVYVESLGKLRFNVKGWAFGREVMIPEHIFDRPQFVETVWKLPMHLLRDPRQLLQKDCSNF